MCSTILLTPTTAFEIAGQYADEPGGATVVCLRSLELESYGQLQQDGKLQTSGAGTHGGGLSTRNYRRAVESVVEGYGIEKSSVSRAVCCGQLPSVVGTVRTAPRRSECVDHQMAFTLGAVRTVTHNLMATGRNKLPAHAALLDPVAFHNTLHRSPIVPRGQSATMRSCTARCSFPSCCN